ncbi:MAG: Short C-terminal protein [Sphaerisporangium sp.]|nr:Short C-terminal protein [Sphaerisporangium sp.]
MRYYVRVCIGSLISLVCLGFAIYALYQLIRGGSCASGGNYVSLRQCPPGTTTWAWVLPGAIIGGLLGLFLAAWKPTPKTDDILAGLSAMARARASDATPLDPASLFGGRANVVRGQLIPDEWMPRLSTSGQGYPSAGQFKSAADFMSSADSMPGQDPLDRLRKLQTLLDAGTLSQAEFELAKARILEEM